LSSIRLLPEQLINRIAAGEVVERPASILKELIENSLDAEAARIEVEAVGGGRRQITVSDNGQGMGPDDLLLSVERHATSKLDGDSDLLEISSLGFRGEALASIGAVSRMTITSCPDSTGHARRVRMAGGRVLSVDDASRAQGTTVEVRDLFYNVPARRKFLKTVQTEAAHLTDTAQRYALARPEVRLVYKHNSQVVLSTSPSEDPQTRVGRVMGRETARQVFPFEGEAGGLTVAGFLGRAEISRSRVNALYLYINGRPVRDSLLTRAVLDAYRGRLMSGRYPVAVIFLTIDPRAVDVNVHPAKAQVRFRSPGEVINAAVTVITGALDRDDRARIPPLEDRPSFRQTPSLYPTPAMLDSQPMRDGGLGPGLLDSNPPARPVFIDRDPAAGLEPSATPLTEAEADRAGLKPIGQLFKTYILAQGRDSLYILDQHAAHERVLFERLASELNSGPLPAQSLLLPVTLELSPTQALGLENTLDRLSRFGFDLAPFGGRTFILKTVPSILGGKDPNALMIEIIDELDEVRPQDGLDRLEEALLSTLACHSAVKAGDEMTLAEMDRLLLDLRAASLPTHCPHGRPLIFRFDLKEIEKKFKRT